MTLSMLLPLLTACATPNFKRTGRPLAAAEQRVSLPVFAVPTVDGRQGNQLLALFVDASKGDEVTLTAVWADEDIQAPLLDLLYDWQRWGQWHRLADVESFSYRYTDFTGATGSPKPQPASITFPNTYSGAQTWDVLPADHHGATLAAEEFLWLDGRPVIFVNTWNHLLSNSNNNPQLDLEFVGDYPVYSGSRAEVQALYEAVYQEQ